MREGDCEWYRFPILINAPNTAYSGASLEVGHDICWQSAVILESINVDDRFVVFRAIGCVCMIKLSFELLEIDTGEVVGECFKGDANHTIT